MALKVTSCAAVVVVGIVLYAEIPVSEQTSALSTVAMADAAVCPVTPPNGKRVDGRSGGGNYGNDALVTGLWPEGTVVFKPGGPGFVLADDRRTSSRRRRAATARACTLLLLDWISSHKFDLSDAWLLGGHRPRR